MAKYKRTFTAIINYSDHLGRHTERTPITLVVEANNAEQAKYSFYSIAKMGYLTWGYETPIEEIE